MHVRQVYRALERRAQRVVIQMGVLSVRIKEPLFIHIIGGEVFETSVTEVVKECDHPALVRTVDVTLYRCPVAVTTDDVGPYVHRLGSRTRQRMMVFPMPVLELHIIDMIAVQIVEHRCHLTLGHTAVGG